MTSVLDYEVTTDSSTCKFQIRLKKLTKEFGKVAECQIYDFTTGSDENETIWRINVYPKGIREKTKEYLGICMQVYSNLPIRGSYKFYLIDGFGRKKYEESFDQIFQECNKEVGYGSCYFAPRDEIFDVKNSLLVNDTLTLAGEVTFDKDLNFSTKYSMEQESKCLKELFRNRTFADVEIKIKERSIKAHKVILAKSSRVIRERLLNENSDILKLDNSLDYDVVEDIVNFLYDEPMNKLQKHALTYLMLADQYQIDTLKKHCEKYLFTQLTLANVLDTLLSAVELYAQELESQCLHFIVKNISIIVHQNWEEFVLNYPFLFKDIFKLTVAQISKKLALNYPRNFQPMSTRKNLAVQENELVQDYENLYTNMILTDVVLEVGGKSLNAHKIILASRSSVFRAMFCSNNRESIENRVVIEDFDFETMQELLRFIYYGKALNLPRLGISLLKAADKYNLIKLKEICSKSLETQMTVQNISEILELSDLHICDNLKKESIAFLGRNVLEVVETKEWENYVIANPKLVNEIFLSWVKICYLKRSLSDAGDTRCKRN